ncbi:MAG: hypothetical protein ACLGGX_11440 [Bdellovibrionia bacterium]
MLLMWLGAFFLFYFSFLQLQKNWTLLFSNFLYQQLENYNSRLLKPILQTSLVSSITVADPFLQERWALQMFNWRVLPKRSGLLLLCTGTLGFWLQLALGFGLFALNSLLILGSAIIIFLLIGYSKNSGRKFLLTFTQLLFFTGLFYFSAENLLRNQSILQTYLGTSELAFLLVDKRFTSLALIFSLSFFVSLILRFPYWSFLVSLVLIPSGAIALLTGLSLFAGELLAASLRNALLFRKTNLEVKTSSTVAGALSVLSVLLVWLCLPLIVSLIGWGGFAAGDLRVLLLQFLFLSAFLLFVRFAALMTWGHFAAKTPYDEIQEPFFVDIRQHELRQTALAKWGTQKLKKRLSEINYHLEGLKSMPQERVPEALRHRLDHEQKIIADLIASPTSMDHLDGHE